MREAVFVRQHAPEWETFERLLASPDTADPDALAASYVRLTDDLAYAQTFYPGSVTAAYLNELSAEVHARLYRNQREERGRLRRFFTAEVPRAVYDARWALAVSLALFVGAVLLGALSSALDDRFARLILGDAYVNMTLANIAQGDPFAVYKDAHMGFMSASIAANNVLVSFFAFAGVLFAGEAVLPAFALGTAQTLVRNGVMVGAFFHLFAAEGLAADWFRVVFIHGALELSAIVVAGGAGLTMGGALLAPGTYPRLTSFRRGAVRGLKIIVGLVPVFAVAAALEGYVTRRTEMPLWASALVIIGSFAYVLWYYVYLPYRVARRGGGRDAARHRAP
ncbi:MAG: stage II sporulation protein M [Rubricoccaceae bacterium]